MHDTSSAQPEHIELWNEQRITSWQDYHLSGMPELISSFNLCHALLALANTGLLDRIRDRGPVAADELLAGLDGCDGREFLRYLTVSGVLSHWQDKYQLTRRGELLTADVALARLGFYLEAYGPVTQRTTDLLTGAARYGRDVVRADGQLGRHSGTVTTTSYLQIIMDAMRGKGATRLLDVGCGGGSLLVELCERHPELTGVGIDIAPDAIEAARKLATDRGVADRVEFFVADAFAPDTWPAPCLTADVICGLGVLHERFRDGDEAVVEILNRYATVVPNGKTLLIGEPELRYDNRENDSDFFLVHILTAQGIPRDRTAWLALFEKTELVCRRIYTSAVAGPRTCFYELTPGADRSA
ncbi:SAM-dependent methyltransferase [Kitasatospora sp. NPDC006697]|uniref:SAM-dependent methyltransferase n=1 Tax=Kitasatospora sp. NPDC006697 TaxID=3364020 RepID=UPI0036C726F5